MSDMDACAATPRDVLLQELLDSRIPKTEREHAAAREIERLRAALGDVMNNPWDYNLRRAEEAQQIIRLQFQLAELRKKLAFWKNEAAVLQRTFTAQAYARDAGYERRDAEIERLRGLLRRCEPAVCGDIGEWERLTKQEGLHPDAYVAAATKIAEGKKLRDDLREALGE